MEGGGELKFGEGEGVAEVEVTVHVRKGKVAEEFLPRRGKFLAGLGAENLFLFPPFLDLRLDLAEAVPAREALAALARHVRHVVAEAATKVRVSDREMKTRKWKEENRVKTTTFWDGCGLV